MMIQQLYQEQWQRQDISVCHGFEFLFIVYVCLFLPFIVFFVSYFIGLYNRHFSYEIILHFLSASMTNIDIGGSQSFNYNGLIQ